MAKQTSKKHPKTRRENVPSPYELPDRVKILINQSRIKEAFEELCNSTGYTQEEERFYNIKRAHLATQLEKYLMAETFIELAKGGPKNYFYFQALNAETELALKTGDYDRGRRCCEEAQLYGTSDKKRTVLNLGKILEAEGDYAGAITKYQIVAATSTNYTIQKEANYFLGSLAYALGDFQLAEPALKAALRPGKLSQPIYIKLASIYLRQERYQEAMDLVNQLTDPKTGQIGIDRLSIIPVFVAKKTNQPLPSRKSKSYNRNQIIEYKEEEALAHIKENHGKGNNAEGNFSSRVNIEELFTDIKIHMTEANLINEDILDVYEVDYPDAGYDLDDNLVHKIRIITIPGTKDILTMYPSSKPAIKKQGTIQTQVAEQKKIGSKQIDRFNNRFKNFVPKN